MASLQLNADELMPLIRDIVEAIHAEANELKHFFNGKLAITESEAAALLALNPWQLRDIRLSGKISYSRIVGGRIRYTLDDLLGYLRSGRETGTRKSRS